MMMPGRLCLVELDNDLIGTDLVGSSWYSELDNDLIGVDLVGSSWYSEFDNDLVFCCDGLLEAA
jgi:hypothetical protein